MVAAHPRDPRSPQRLTEDLRTDLPEALNLLIKKAKHRPRLLQLGNYRLRLLLHCGVTWRTHDREGAPHVAYSH
jgi:hypothetical protein